MELVSPSGWLYICYTFPSFLPSFLPSDIFLVHWKMDRGHCLHQYAAGSSDVLWKWSIGVHEKRGVSKNFFFASSTSDTDSKAKNNDRWRHLFFDPTIFTSLIIMNNQPIITNNHLIILTTPPHLLLYLMELVSPSGWLYICYTSPYFRHFQ